MNEFWRVVIGTTAAGMATAVGAVPAVFFPAAVPRRAENTMLGFAAGVMLAATVFSLIAPALEIGGPAIAAAGVAAGALLLHLADRFLPHEHFYIGREGADVGLRGIWLFVIAIALHNMPEGLAVGVAYGSGSASDGNVLALAIGLQNIPEGLAVALALMRAGYSRRTAFMWAALTGLVEPPAGYIGYAMVGLMRPLLPWGLAFAGGAMLFVISDEIIPETHSEGRERWATAGLIAGFVVMMVLDTALG